MDVCADRGRTTEIVISPLSPFSCVAGGCVVRSMCSGARDGSGVLAGGGPSSSSLVLTRCSGSGVVAASGETVSAPAPLIVVRKAAPQWRQ